MDKQDQLAAAILNAVDADGDMVLYAGTFYTREATAAIIAAAVRSFMGSESQIAAASKAVAVTRFMREYSWVAREQIVDIIGACHDHEDARAALSAAVGEPEGALRNPDV